MKLLNAQLAGLGESPLVELDETVRSIYRLIVFSESHKQSDLLTRSLEAMQHLRPRAVARQLSRWMRRFANHFSRTCCRPLPCKQS